MHKNHEYQANSISSARSVIRLLSENVRRYRYRRYRRMSVDIDIVDVERYYII